MLLSRQFVARLVFVFFVSFLAFHELQGQSVEQEEVKIGKPIVREIRGGEALEFPLRLGAKSYVEVVANQNGVDVILTLIDPSGKPIATLDSPNGRKGPELLQLITDSAGMFILRLSSTESESISGTFELKLLQSRLATPKDSAYIEGRKLFTEAGALLNQIQRISRRENRVPSMENDGQSKEKARVDLEIALAQFTDAEQEEWQANTISQLGLLEAIFGNIPKAIEFWSESLVIYEHCVSESAVNNILNLGRAYSRIGNYAEAIRTYKNGLEFVERSSIRSDIWYCLFALGSTYRDLGDFKTALEYFLLATGVTPISRENAASSLHEVGSTYSNLGNYLKALEYQQKALEMYETTGDQGLIASMYVNISATYIRQNSLDLASDYAKQALEGFEKINGKGGMGTALLNIGTACDLKGDYLCALNSFQKALTLFEELNWDERIAYTHSEIGRVFLHKGDTRIALQSMLEGQQVFERLPDKADIAENLVSVAQAYFRMNQLDSALTTATRAVALSMQTGVRDLLWRSLVVQGKVERAKGQIDRAIKTISKSIEVIEGLRLEVAGGDSQQLEFLDDKISPYLEMLKMQVARENIDDAFGFAEKTKSRTLLDTLNFGKTQFFLDVDAESGAKWQRLKEELMSLNSQYQIAVASSTPDGTKIKQLSTQIDEKRLEFIGFQSGLYALNPNLRFQHGDLTTISGSELSEILRQDTTAAIEFVTDENDWYVFVLTRNRNDKTNLKVITFNASQRRIPELVSAFHQSIASGDLDFRKDSRKLYDLLIKPIEKELAGKTNLIIVPDGPLWDLPFQALQDEKGKYLIEKAAVSYAPSLTALREMSKKASQRKPGTDAELIAFGNPIVEKETSERIKRVFMSEKLDALPEAERLVKELGKMYGPSRSRIYVGNEARESTAKSEAPRYRIVQFATHGILNNISPMYSHLVMAQNTKNPDEDGLLEAWEMKDLDLKADMVILSACDTARGKISNGEGVIGMTWAMFIAGAPTTVASQWKVESSSTTELMLEFHRQLLSGKNISKAEALRRASLKVMKMPGFSHPSDWAGFVIVGDGR